MATTLSAGPTKVSVSGQLDLVRAAPGNVSDNSGFTYTGPSLTNGTGAGQADRRYIAQHTIAASGTLTLNLSSLLDSFGNAVAFLKVKEVYIELTTGTAASGISIGGGSNPWVGWISSGTATLGPVGNGCVFYLGCRRDAAGWAVVPSTGDSLRLSNLDAGLAAVVNVLIVGTSA